MTFDVRKLLKPIKWPDAARLRLMAENRLLEAGSVLGLAITAHMAVVGIPGLTSSDLEDYMKDNNAPIELIEAVKGIDAQVYDDNSVFSAHHYAWNTAKMEPPSSAKDTLDTNDGFKATYKESFNHVRNGNARAQSGFYQDGGSQIVMQPRMDIKEFIHKRLGFELDDIELDESLTESEYLFVLMHEVSHLNQPDYCSPHEYGGDAAMGDSENEAVLRGEIAADYGAIMALERAGIDIADYRIALRSVGSVSCVSTHDTAYYIDALIKGDDSPDVKGHDEDRKSLERLSSTHRALFSALHQGQHDQKLSENDLTYISMLKVLDGAESYEEVTPRMIRTAELYVEGFEYFVPSKAQELRELIGIPDVAPSDTLDVDVPSV